MSQIRISETTPETELLRARLDSLLREEASVSRRSRHLMKGIGCDARDALLSAICETQRPRRMVFRNERNEELTFEIASRRILRLSHPTSDNLLNNLEACSVREVYVSALGHVHLLRRLLDVFTADNTELTVQSLPLNVEASATEIGLTLDDISVRLEEHVQLQPEELFVGFLQACESFSSSALLLCDGQPVFHYGSTTDFETLTILAQSERDASAASDRDGNKVSCVIFSGHPTDGSALLCQVSGKYLSLLNFNCHALDKVLLQWNQISG